MHTCCLEPNNNITLTNDDSFHIPEYGDFTITYDVLSTYATNYQAQVHFVLAILSYCANTVILGQRCFGLDLMLCNVVALGKKFGKLILHPF